MWAREPTRRPVESAGNPSRALCLCLKLLSLQKPPREEEEEALTVTDRVQGRLPVSVPEQAVHTPARGPLGQHLSRGESGLQPGALQVTPRAQRLSALGSGLPPVRASPRGLLLCDSPPRRDEGGCGAGGPLSALLGKHVSP